MHPDANLQFPIGSLSEHGGPPRTEFSTSRLTSRPDTACYTRAVANRTPGGLRYDNARVAFCDHRAGRRRRSRHDSAAATEGAAGQPRRFLDSHQKPDRYIPEGAKIVGTLPGGGELPPTTPPAAKPVKQYTVQIISHRPVPDQPEPSRVDVYYYRPNPERGRPGVTVKYTVDLNSGNQVGETEVLLIITRRWPKRKSPWVR